MPLFPDIASSTIRPGNSTNTAALPDVVALAGPIFIGVLLNWALYGVLLVQVYIYFSAFKTDKWSARVLVTGLFCLDTLQSVIVARDGFDTFARWFGSESSLSSVRLIWISLPLISAVVSMIVQGFFAYRIYVLSRENVCIPALVACTSLGQGIGSILCSVKTKEVQIYALVSTHSHIEIIVWHAGSALCDVIIALAMCYYLWKRDTGMKKTHTMIIRLMTLTIETGTATAAVALLSLILFFATPSKIYFIAPTFLGAKLYANTVVLTFNNRAQIISATPSTLYMDGVEIRQDTGMSGVANNQIQFVVDHSGAGVHVSKSVSVWEDHREHSTELSNASNGTIDVSVGA